MVIVFLAQGFEEMEALCTVDLLRRAEIDVQTAGVDDVWVTGAHRITVRADMPASKVRYEDLEMIVLPGGMPGTLFLEQSASVQEAVSYCLEKNIWVASICAAPLIPGHKGALAGKKAVCFPGLEEELKGALIQDTDVCSDGNMVTAKAAGAVVPFALELIEILKGKQKAQKIGQSIYWKTNGRMEEKA